MTGQRVGGRLSALRGRLLPSIELMSTRRAETGEKQMIRVYGQAVAQIADAEVRLFHLYVHEPLMRSGEE